MHFKLSINIKQRTYLSYVDLISQQSAFLFHRQMTILIYGERKEDFVVLTSLANLTNLAFHLQYFDHTTLEYQLLLSNQSQFFPVEMLGLIGRLIYKLSNFQLHLEVILARFFLGLLWFFNCHIQQMRQGRHRFSCLPKIQKGLTKFLKNPKRFCHISNTANVQGLISKKL